MISSDDEDREYPKHPMVGVGAIILRGDEVLLVKRSKEPSKGLWSIPGGLVEIGESLRDALTREVAEECGMNVEPLELLDAVDAVHRDSEGRVRFHYVIVDYIARWREGEPVAGSDVERVSWTPIRDLDKLQVTPTARAVIQKAVRGRSD